MKRSFLAWMVVMIIKSKYISAAWKGIAFVSAVIGILLQCGIFSGKTDFSVLNYYTLMSNILCAVYFLPAVFYTLKNTEKTMMPQLKGALVMCITVTGMVYHFMLAGKFEMQGTLLVSNMLLHYVVPIMTVLDWILFDHKGNYKRFSPFLWLIAPLVYFIYVVVRVAGGALLGPYGAKYPYYFMDIDALGLGTVMLINLVMAVFFLILGYIIVWIDHLLQRKIQNKSSK